MSKAANTLLALAFSRHTLHLAELQGAGAAATVTRRSKLAWASDDGLPDAALGESLKAHLHAEGYAAKRVAVGLPGSWVLARHWSLPPVDDSAVAGIARLRIEKEFTSSAFPLSFDLIDASAAEGQRGALLVGVRKDRLDAVRDMLSAAHLQPLAIGITSLATVTDPDARVVVIENGHTTVCGRHQHQPYGLVSTPTAADPDRWLADTNRLLATLHAPAGSPSDTLQIVDYSAHDPNLFDAAASRWVHATGRRADPAEAVGRSALSSASPQVGQINWLADRLTPPAPKRFGRGTAWVLRAAACVLALGFALGFYWYQVTQQRDALKSELQSIAAEAKQLGTLHDRTREAAGWFDQRPPMLECLLELTRTFPKTGQIWVTQFTLDDQRLGVVRCKAQDKDTMLTYLNAMQDSPALQDVELRDWNAAGRDNQTVVFEITFRYALSASASGGAV